MLLPRPQKYVVSAGSGFLLSSGRFQVILISNFSAFGSTMSLSSREDVSESTRNDGASVLSSLNTAHDERTMLRTSSSSAGLEEFGTAFANAGGYIPKEIGMLWPLLGADYQDLIAVPQYVPRPPSPPVPVPGIDEVYAAEAPLRRLLALASAVGLPQQIEREEANRAAEGESVLESDVEEHHVAEGVAK